MKKQKRNQIEKAFLKGYQAAIEGRSKSLCPYLQEGSVRQNWLNGWREGREDHWNGYSKATGHRKVGLIQAGFH